MTFARLSRRALLRGAGGVMLGLPWLASVRGLAEGPAPKRLILVYNPNGVLPTEYWPQAESGATSFQLGPMLEPLQKHASQLAVLKGLTLKVAGIGPGGPHQKGIGGLFTGRELLAGKFADGCGSLAGFAAGPSVDQEVAQHLGGDTRFKSLEFGVRCTRSDVQSRIIYAAANQPLPPMTSPLAAFERVFGQGSGFTPSTQANGASRKRSVVGAVLGELSALRARVSADDQLVLDRHTTLVRDLERRLGFAAGTCEPPSKPNELAEESEETMEELAKLQVDLLALALTCDATRVASLQFSDGYNRIRMPWVGSDGEGHNLSHSGVSNTAARTQLVARQQWYAAMVVRLMDHLASVREGDGTMLDNTLIVWGNEIGEGSSHTHKDIPLILAGGAGGALRTGIFMDYKGRPHNDLLLTVLHAMGIRADSFGHPDYVTGPLSELLVG